MSERQMPWLLDLAQHSPASWKLHGSDVSDANFPSPHYLPKNVSLQILDIFEEIPRELMGAFDIVHVRALANVVKGGNPEHLIAHLVSLLKPGGFLQWDEFDSNTLAGHLPAGKGSKDSIQKLISVWHQFAKKLDVQIGLVAMKPQHHFQATDIPSWMRTLNDHIAWSGLDVMEYSRFGPIDWLRKAATDNWLMGLEEVGFTIIGQQGEDLLISAKEYAGLLQHAAAETRDSASIWMDMQVVLARRAKT
ncbi:MAG: hypothetical protein Q9212_001475 [Teloschistes hypoglaucus]